MLDKYQIQFKEMYQRIIVGKEKPLEVISEHVPFFEKEERIGVIGIASYLGTYLEKVNLAKV